MKKAYFLLGLISCLLSGCVDNSADNITANGKAPKKYYKSLNKNQCLSIIFPDYRLDSVYNEQQYYNPDAPADGDRSGVDYIATGKLDTTWCVKYGSFKEMFTVYGNQLDSSTYIPRGRHTSKRVGSKQGYFADYSVDYYVEYNDLKIFLYSPKSFKVKDVPLATGVAVFGHTPKGWTIVINKPDFYKRIPANHGTMAAAITKSNDGKPLLVFSIETVSSLVLPERKLLVTGTDLISKEITLSKNVEFYGGEFVRTNLSYSVKSTSMGWAFNEAVTKALNEISATNPKDLADSCYISYSVNPKGKLVGLSARASDNTLNFTGAVAEGQGFAENGYKLTYAGSGLWKNKYYEKVYYFGSDNLNTDFEVLSVGDTYGDDYDSALVINEGNDYLRRKYAKRDAESAAAADAYAERESVRKQRDAYFDNMKAQQQQDRAVDEVIRKAGLCSYCSGRGCLQCNGTGKLQRGY